MPGKMPYGSAAYFKASPAKIEEFCDGCGAFGTDVLLDWIVGIYVRPACCAHDFEYVTMTISKATADKYFYENLLYLIYRSNKNEFRKWVARRIAWVYYMAVKAFKPLH